MPRRAKGNAVTLKVPFNVYVALTCSSNVAFLNLTPEAVSSALGNFGTRLNQISDAFEFFRFTKVSVEIPPQRMTSAGDGIMGYAPVYSINSPTTFAQISELPSISPMIPVGLSTTFSATTRTIRWNLPKKLLLGEQIQWYRTRASANPATEFEQQGTIWMYGPVAAGIFGFMVHGVIELKGMIATGLSMSRPLGSEHKGAEPPVEIGPLPVCIEQPGESDLVDVVSATSQVVVDAQPSARSRPGRNEGLSVRQPLAGLSAPVMSGLTTRPGK